MILTKGYFQAEINADDLEDVQVSISMCCPLDTTEAMLPQDETQLASELSALRYMIHDYVTFLYEEREGRLAYAV